MREASRFRSLPLFGFAVAGLLVGHALSYLIAIPDPHHRDLVLHRTGHGYLPALAQIAVILAIAAVTMVVGSAFTRRSAGTAGSYAALSRRLAVIQVSAFAGQELLERLLVGAPLGDLVQGHLLLAGVTAQLLVALTGAALLRWLARTSERLADVATSPFALARALPAFAPSAVAAVPRGRVDGRSHGERAPPSA
jgi:hypothetical protein